MTGINMEQKIFNLNLSVETVSVYLLCCALADIHVPITLEALRERWNAAPDDLLEGLATLEKMSIVVCPAPGRYSLNKAAQWQTD